MKKLAIRTIRTMAFHKAFTLQMQIVSHSKEACVEANALALALILTPDFFLEYLCGYLEQWGQYHFLGMVTSPRDRHDVWNLPYEHSSLLHTMVSPSHNVLQKHMLPSLGPFTSSLPRLVYQHPSTWGRRFARMHPVLEELLSNAAHRVGFFPSLIVHFPSGQQHTQQSHSVSSL